MREETLKRYFDDRASAEELKRDLVGSREKVSKMEYRLHIVHMESDFEVKREHMLKLCDAFLTGELEAESLRIIGSALMMSDRFTWDGERDEVISQVAFCWSAPQINYELTRETIAMFRQWLLGEEPLPKRERSQQ